MSAYRRITGGVRVTEWLVVGTFVQECFKSGFKHRCRDIEIIGDCMRECIPDTRGSAACEKLRCTNAVRGRGMLSRL